MKRLKDVPVKDHSFAQASDGLFIFFFAFGQLLSIRE